MWVNFCGQPPQAASVKQQARQGDEQHARQHGAEESFPLRGDEDAGQRSPQVEVVPRQVERAVFHQQGGSQQGGQAAKNGGRLRPRRNQAGRKRGR